MSLSQISKNSSSSNNCPNNNNNDNNQQEPDFNKYRQQLKDLNNKDNCISMRFPFEECINSFDDANFKLIQEKKFSKEMVDKFIQNADKTPLSQRESLSNELIDLINTMKKSDIYKELPQLPYGKQLTDREFIDLLKECVSYANYKLESENLDVIKNRLSKEYLPALKNLFNRGQIVKDIIENALITILTADTEKDQEDNFSLLKVENSTGSPIVSMDFGNKKENRLDIQELQDNFCSPIYIKNYQKALKKFFDKIPSEKKLKEYIRNNLQKYNIYFCDLPADVLAFTIHTGNIYLKGEYLYEYYNENKEDNLLLVREKIILNIGHEIMHLLMREISEEMKKNFLIKSNPLNKSNNDYIEFKEKFTDQIQQFSTDESGDTFDFLFFNKYYFDDLYLDEAKFFFNIKKYSSLSDYKNNLESIIRNEKIRYNNLKPKKVNKFKKLNIVKPRRCIRSTILGVRTAEKEENITISSDSSDNNENE